MFISNYLIILILLILNLNYVYCSINSNEFENNLIILEEKADLIYCTSYDILMYEYELMHRRSLSLIPPKSREKYLGLKLFKKSNEYNEKEIENDIYLVKLWKNNVLNLLYAMRDVYYSSEFQSYYEMEIIPHLFHWPFIAEYIHHLKILEKDQLFRDKWKSALFSGENYALGYVPSIYYENKLYRPERVQHVFHLLTILRSLNLGISDLKQIVEFGKELIIIKLFIYYYIYY
jgi:hypothetical protein